MRRLLLVLFLTVVGLAFLVCTPSSVAKQPADQLASFGKYLRIPGATPVGSDTCATCHADVAKNFQHAYHAQQGVGCEECHGAGSLHVAGGGDTAKIISPQKRSATEANGVCLSCHAQEVNVRHWSSGVHAANHVRCIDCHQVHASVVPASSVGRGSFNTATSGALNAKFVSPETDAMVQTRAASNDACLRCHQTENAQLSMPYHHPLREGKMTCADCHDAHGGNAGNNLRTANVNELCLGCHAQYRGPFAYQHPPVTENCLNCHTAHGSPNTNLLSVSEPALCLQCHSGHHNGAALPLDDRCTNCHSSIHGTDVATPSGGSRFVDKGPIGVPSEPVQPAPAASTGSFANPQMAIFAPALVSAASQGSASSMAAIGGMLAMLSSPLRHAMPGGNMLGGNGDASGSGAPAETRPGDASAAWSITPASYRLLDGSGFLGRAGEYDSLRQSAGANMTSAYVSPQNHLTLVSQGSVLSGNDYSIRSQLTVGNWLKSGLDLRSLVQQQDNYQFYAGVMSPDLLPITNLIPSGTTFGVTRRLGSGYARMKVPTLPVHLFVKGDMQARVGTTQITYLDENSTPAVYVDGVNTTCGQTCHYTSRFQPVNYTTRNVGGGVDVNLKRMLRLTWEHNFSSFNDRLTFPTATYTGPFTPENEGSSTVNPPPFGPAPTDFPAGNYYLDIPSPNQLSTDSVDLNLTPSDRLTFNGHVSYARLRNTFTQNPQNWFDSDETLNWLPLPRLRVIADYHRQNLINNFTPYYSMYGNVSYHRHWEGLRVKYALPAGLDVEAHYRRSGITRSNAFLWPQIYSMDNTDLLRVVPSSFSNTLGLTLHYHNRLWNARTGDEWTGTHQPGFLIVPQSDNRAFADVWFTPRNWLAFTNDTSITVQNDFSAAPLPNTPSVAPGFGGDISGLPAAFQRRDRFYTEAASATMRFVPDWNLALGYSYQQNDLTSYMAFQNDSSVGYVLDEPNVPYKQIGQVYWGDSTYTLKKRLGLDLRLTHNSSSSGFRPDLNPNDAAQLGNAALIQQGAFDPGLFQQALGNVQLGATQVSAVQVPQWLGQSKGYYLFPHKFEGGLVFYYGSYSDHWNPNLNGVLRTFDVYVGRSW